MKHFAADLSINDVNLAIEEKRKNEAREPLIAEFCPKEFYYLFRDKKEKRINPEFFNAGAGPESRQANAPIWAAKMSDDWACRL